MSKIASREQLKKIALYCDKYSPKENEGLKSSTASSKDGHESCVKCSHYNKEGKCNLDLIDPILTSMAMELDFKS